MLLALILWPNIRWNRWAYGMSRCKENLLSLRDAAERYACEHDGLYPESLSDLTPEHLTALPICPVAGKDTHSESYQVRTDPQLPTLRCCNHQRLNSPECRQRLTELQASLLEAGAPLSEPLEETATCPLRGEPLQYLNRRQSYQISCVGGNHGDGRFEGNFPRWNSDEGLLDRP